MVVWREGSQLVHCGSRESILFLLPVRCIVRLDINLLFSLAVSVIWLFRNSVCRVETQCIELVKTDFGNPSSLMWKCMLEWGLLISWCRNCCIFKIKEWGLWLIRCVYEVSSSAVRIWLKLNFLLELNLSMQTCQQTFIEFLLWI